MSGSRGGVKNGNRSRGRSWRNDEEQWERELELARERELRRE